MLNASVVHGEVSNADPRRTEPILSTNNNLHVQSFSGFTKMVDHHMHIELNIITLASDTAIDDRTITLQAGHSLVVGNCIHLKEDTRFYQGTVLTVVTNTITLDMPLDFAFTTAASGQRCTQSLNVNGSAAEQIAHINPPAGAIWNIIRLIIHITDGTAMDNSTFGGISALTNGIVLRVKNGFYSNVFNIKNNGDFIEHSFDVAYDDKAPAGTFGFRARTTFAGLDKRGVIVRLTDTDELQLLINDDLTALLDFAIVAQGHYTRDI